MATTKQKEVKTNNEISPLANDRTFGERVHHLVFNVGINFFANLLVSAGFSYWVAHSTRAFGASGERPAVRQKGLENWIGRNVLRVGEGDDAPFRRKAAQSMAGVATLTAAGHFIMIPSVWIGAKIKAPMVKWLNAWHYGDGAMDDPSLKARHDALEIEERPTLLGAIVGRAGTIVATQTTAWAIGHDRNFVTLGARKMGMKLGQNFKGIDAVTESIGDAAGGVVAQKFPTHNAKLNASMAARGYGWSPNQLAAHPQLASQPYGTRISTALPGGGTEHIGGGLYEHFGRYLSADVIYTFVTSLTITPAINFLKKFIPGMTYTPKAATRMDEETLRTAREINVKPHPLRDEKPAAAAPEQPSPRIDAAQARHVERVATTPQLEVAPA